MNRKSDKFGLGLILGIIFPALVLIIFYYSSYAYLTVPDFLRKMVFQSILFKLLSLCAVVNLGVFFFFYQTQNDKAAKGVIFATMLFAFAVILNQVLSGTLE